MPGRHDRGPTGALHAPRIPVPSIVDYRPKSTLVSQTHLVPKAKFPAIDFHGHPGQLLGSADGLGSLDDRRSIR